MRVCVFLCVCVCGKTYSLFVIDFMADILIFVSLPSGVFFMMNEFNFLIQFAAAAVAVSAFVGDLLDDVSLDTDSIHRPRLLAFYYYYYSLRSFDFGKLYVGIASSHMLYCHPKRIHSTIEWMVDEWMRRKREKRKIN